MYTVDYFIDKFSKIPASRFATGTQSDGNGNHCAYGWCGINYYTNGSLNNDTGERTEEGIALTDVFVPIMNGMGMASINNGRHPVYQQPTAKERILAALYDIKKQQQPAYVNISKQLAVLPTEETSDKIVAGKTVMVEKEQ